VRRLLRLAHRAYLLEEGHVVLSGPGPELLQDERLRRSLIELIPGVDQPMG
jgi:ABC-type branched-subunit amino acid transport system ATPase component